jgi:ACS family tartrate transporter-like MFS transporter
MSLYRIVLWLPQLASGFGLSTQQIGFVTPNPTSWRRAACISTARARQRSPSAPRLTVGSPFLNLLALCAAAWGIYAALPVFWAAPARLLTGAAAAGATGLIDPLGNLGGFVGPYVGGWLRQARGNFDASLILPRPRLSRRRRHRPFRPL